MKKNKHVYILVKYEKSKDNTVKNVKSFSSMEKAYNHALLLARKECDMLNEEDPGHYSIGEYETTYDEKMFEQTFPVSVLWYEKTPDDRENDCDIKLITGYDIIDNR